MAEPLRLVVGLGNPGPEYARTRHNIGFQVIDELARRYGVELGKTKNGARSVVVRDHHLVLAEPQTYMNDSGIPTRSLASWFRIPPENIFVVVDDLDLPFGKLRARASGGSGGHNGLKSVIAHLGEGFPRLRVGIGRGRNGEAIGHVLGTWTDAEARAVPTIIDAAANTVERFLDRGIVTAANYSNAWELPISDA